MDTKARKELDRLLREIAAEHDLKLVSIADLIRWRRRHEKLIQRAAEVVDGFPDGDLEGGTFEIAAHAAGVHVIETSRRQAVGQE